jgi:hypothetical protein
MKLMGEHRLWRYDSDGKLLNEPEWRHNAITADGLNHFLNVTAGHSTDRLGNATRLRVRNGAGGTVHTYTLNASGYPQTYQQGNAPECHLYWRWVDNHGVQRTDMRHFDVLSPNGVWFSTADLNYGTKPTLETWVFDYQIYSFITLANPLDILGVDRIFGNFVRSDYGGAFTPDNLLAVIKTGGTSFGEATTPHVSVDTASNPKRLRMDFTFHGPQGQGDWGPATMEVWHGGSERVRIGGTGTSGVKGSAEQWTWPYEILVTV